MSQIKDRVVCTECGCDTMHVFDKDSCDDCVHNGVLDIEKCEYTYPETLKSGDVRTEVNNEGLCEIESSNNCGCTYYRCSACGHYIKQVPYVEY